MLREVCLESGSRTAAAARRPFRPAAIFVGPDAPPHWDSATALCLWPQPQIAALASVCGPAPTLPARPARASPPLSALASHCPTGEAQPRPPPPRPPPRRRRAYMSTTRGRIMVSVRSPAMMSTPKTCSRPRWACHALATVGLQAWRLPAHARWPFAAPSRLSSLLLAFASLLSSPASLLSRPLSFCTGRWWWP